MRKSLIALSALALGGFLISLELIEVHLLAHYGGGSTDTGLCSALPGFSCEAVAQSALSEIAGFPVAGIGAAFYIPVVVLAFLVRVAGDSVKALPDVLLAASGAAVGYSLFLGGASAFVLGKVCPFCVGLYAVNVGLLVAALLGHPDRFGAVVGRIPALFGRSGFWAAIGVMVIATLGVSGAYAQQKKAFAAKSNLAQPIDEKTVDIDVSRSPGKGPEDAPVIVVEFSDFECPFCQRLADGLSTAAQEAGNVRVYFRHYPMDHACNSQFDEPFHETACDAARAAICAQKMGSFWPMHDAMFAHSKELQREKLLGYAAELGLDPDSLHNCLDDPETTKQLSADIRAGVALGVKGTPTFFVNGSRYEGARAVEHLLAIFADAAKRAGEPTAAQP